MLKFRVMKSGILRGNCGYLSLLLLLTSPLVGQELLIENGTVVTAEASFAADVLVENGRITAIGENLTSTSAITRIDANGKLVMPGGVDPHVHLGLRNEWVDDYHTGSMAALAGGITTISNFPYAAPGTNLRDLLESEAQLIRDQSIADVILHTIITEPQSQTAQLQTLIDMGQPSIKVFMNFEFFDPNASQFLETIEVAGNAGIITLIHAEDAAVLDHQATTLEANGQTTIRYQSAARPPLAEQVAMERAVAMAEQSGSPIYAVHVSSERALKVAQDARSRGLPFFIETRPIYLHLTDDRFEGEEPGIYVGQPPLRAQSDQDALWQALENGSIQVIGTDHVAYSREDKVDPSQTIRNHRAGMNHLQMLRPLLYSDGVLKGRISVERMVELTSTNPAKIFGLFPQKGTIAVGSDADIVIWDPEETRVVRDEDMFSATGFSIYSGWEVTGWPITTIRRGEIVYDNGEILGTAGTGRLLERDSWQSP